MAELFDPSLKKKKKKSVAFNEDPLSAEVDPTTPADVDDANGHDLGPKTVHERVKQNGSAANGDGEDGKPEDDEFKAMFGDLKKKKKKKDISADVDEEPSASAATKEPAAAEDLDFSEIKKKKKSKKKAAADLEAFEKELGEAKEDEDEDEDGADMDFQDEHDDLVDDIFDRGGDVVVEGAEPWAGSDRDYTYSELLRRFYTQLHAQNPSLLSATGKRHTIPPPVIHREGKKSVFANVTEICKRMRRPPDHVIQYLFSEMGTTGSVDGAGRLVIKGRFQQKQVEHVLRGYIVEYVICKTCKSPDTQLTKENRIFFTTCESCGSRRSVNAIKSGFQAQVGRRSRMKTG